MVDKEQEDLYKNDSCLRVLPRVCQGMPFVVLNDPEYTAATVEDAEVEEKFDFAEVIEVVNLVDSVENIEVVDNVGASSSSGLMDSEPAKLPNQDDNIQVVERLDIDVVVPKCRPLHSNAVEVISETCPSTLPKTAENDVSDANNDDQIEVDEAFMEEESNISVTKCDSAYRRFLPTEEEAQQLIIKDPSIPRFVGLKDGKLHTYNTDGSWQQMLSFMEILCYLEKYPGIPEQCQSTLSALQMIQEEIGRNPSLFESWFHYEKPVGADCSTEYFYWGNLRNRVFVIRWMKELHGIHYRNEEGLKRSKEVKRKKKENNPDYKSMRKLKYQENRKQRRRAESAAKKAAKAVNPQVDYY